MPGHRPTRHSRLHAWAGEVIWIKAAEGLDRHADIFMKLTSVKLTLRKPVVTDMFQRMSVILPVLYQWMTRNRLNSATLCQKLSRPDQSGRFPCHANHTGESTRHSSLNAWGARENDKGRLSDLNSYGKWRDSHQRVNRIS